MRARVTGATNLRKANDALEHPRWDRIRCSTTRFCPLAPMLTVAIDTGGTFTDLVARDPDGNLIRLKVPSTPHDPSEGVLNALGELRAINQSFEQLSLRHGTTVATNSILERDGSRVVLVTNRGFEDLLWLKRQNRPDLYALEPRLPAPLVDEGHVLGVTGRRRWDGTIRQPLEDLDAWADRHHQALASAEAFAICLLHSYRCPDDERAVGRLLRARFPETPLSLSCDVAPLPKEFERCSTTVVNAYVAQRMSAYLSSLRTALSAASALSIMGSSGSLHTAKTAIQVPSRTALSGPAGGVRGAWEVGRRCARSALLTVDMGGTSTDVSVVRDTLLPEPGGQVGDHPLLLPLLPIETVGAGGGSIAFIDSGGILKVGPRSAGAVPGPACYGHPDATEPTVTDANVVLGRLENLLGGEMMLDADASRRAVDTLASQLGRTIEDVARAIVDIAVANMARACKSVLINQGGDAESLSLVAFGGATGLHACDLADELGCRDVIFPAEPGVLSAEGILNAPHEVSRVYSVLAYESDWTPAMLNTLVEGALAEIKSEGPGITRLTADCRYSGQDWTLSVELSARPSPEALAERFHDAHTERYGYDLKGERRIEFVSLRLRWEEAEEAPPTIGQATDERVEGPTVISGYSSTLYLPAGWRATTLSSGDYLCERVEESKRPDRQRPVEFDVHRQRLLAIAEEMGATLTQAAFSANIKERLDLSCAIFDRAGHLLCHAAHIPVHLGSTPLSVRAAMEDVDFRRCASAFLNDPYRGGTHLPDVTVVSGVFDGDGDEPVFFVANRAHHADVGGRLPGSIAPLQDLTGARRRLSIDDEGIRIPPMALDDESRRQFAEASRLPSERLGDLRAQEAANYVGGLRLSQWLSETSSEALQTLNDALLDYSEQLMRSLISSIPDGRYEFIDQMDGDGGSSQPLEVPVCLTIHGSRATVDFRAARDCVDGPVNAVRAIVLSAVFYCFRCLAGDSIPANEGLMRPIEVLTRPGSFLDAVPPFPVAAGNVETSQRLVDAVFGALAQAVPNLIPAASAGTMNNVIFGGLDNRQTPPSRFVHYETLAGGAGAGPNGPGADAIQLHMTNTLNTPIESLERLFPVEIERYMRRPKTGNEDCHSGGRGVLRVYRFLGTAEVSLLTERRVTAPWGVGGAPAGQLGRNVLRRANGERVMLPSKVSLSLERGDILEVHTPSGGSWASDDQ